MGCWRRRVCLGPFQTLAQCSADGSRLQQVRLEGCTPQLSRELLLLLVLLFITHRQPFP